MPVPQPSIGAAFTVVIASPLVAPTGPRAVPRVRAGFRPGSCRRRTRCDHRRLTWIAAPGPSHSGRAERPFSMETIARELSFSTFQLRIPKWQSMNATAWQSAKRRPKAPMGETAGGRTRAENGATRRRERIPTGEDAPHHPPRRHESNIEHRLSRNAGERFTRAADTTNSEI